MFGINTKYCLPDSRLDLYIPRALLPVLHLRLRSQANPNALLSTAFQTVGSFLAAYLADIYIPRALPPVLHLRLKSQANPNALLSTAFQAVGSFQTADWAYIPRALPPVLHLRLRSQANPNALLSTAFQTIVDSSIATSAVRCIYRFSS